MLISLVIPLYNEEDGFEKSLQPLISSLDSGRIDYELILVDNGSRDKTGQLIDQQVAKNPRIKKAAVEINEGYGWGITTGLKLAKGEYVGYTWGDGQIDPKDVLETIDRITNQGYDLVKACRVRRKDSLLRWAVSKVYNYIFPMLFDLKSQDLNGAPKLFKRKYLDILDIQSKDWFLDAEIMIKSEYLKLKIEEIPVTFGVRQSGKSNVSLIRDIWQFLRNAYYFKTGKVYSQWKRSRK